MHITANNSGVIKKVIDTSASTNNSTQFDALTKSNLSR